MVAALQQDLSQNPTQEYHVSRPQFIPESDLSKTIDALSALRLEVPEKSTLPTDFHPRLGTTDTNLAGAFRVRRPHGDSTVATVRLAEIGDEPTIEINTPPWPERTTPLKVSVENGQLTWGPVGENAYQVYTSNDLENWTALGLPLPPEQNSITVETTSGNKFFVVKELPPLGAQIITSATSLDKVQGDLKIDIFSWRYGSAQLANVDFVLDGEKVASRPISGSTNLTTITFDTLVYNNKVHNLQISVEDDSNRGQESLIAPHREEHSLDFTTQNDICAWNFTGQIESVYLFSFQTPWTEGSFRIVLVDNQNFILSDTGVRDIAEFPYDEGGSAVTTWDPTVKNNPLYGDAEYLEAVVLFWQPEQQAPAGIQTADVQPPAPQPKERRFRLDKALNVSPVAITVKQDRITSDTQLGAASDETLFDDIAEAMNDSLRLFAPPYDLRGAQYEYWQPAPPNLMVSANEWALFRDDVNGAPRAPIIPTVAGYTGHGLKDGSGIGGTPAWDSQAPRVGQFFTVDQVTNSSMHFMIADGCQTVGPKLFLAKLVGLTSNKQIPLDDTVGAGRFPRAAIGYTQSVVNSSEQLTIRGKWLTIILTRMSDFSDQTLRFRYTFQECIDAATKEYQSMDFGKVIGNSDAKVSDILP